MKCERCGVEMRKEKVHFFIGYGEEQRYPGGKGGYQKPINAKSVYTCKKKKKMELNQNE